MPEEETAEANSGASAGTENLGSRSISAVLWGVLGAFSRTGMQIVAQLILARILGPEQYGLFALGMVVVLFSTFFADVGLAYGLIQRKTVTSRDIRFIFTWQILLGIVVTALLVWAAPWAGEFYGDARLEAVVYWLSFTCLINSVGSTSNCLLRRDLDFKTVNIAAVVSYAIGFLGVGIPMALAGYEVYSLVVAYLVQSSLNALYLFAKARHPLSPLLWHESSREIISFGGTAFATTLINWVMTSVDKLVVGHAMAVSAAGLYATVSNLITSPSMQILQLLQSVLYSASSRVQDSLERLQHGFRTMFGVVALIVGPVFFSIAAIAGTMMHAMYGDEWVGGEVVLAPLAAAMPAYLLMGMAVPVLWASGNITKEFKLQIPIAIIWVIVLLAISQAGDLALLSWSVCALFYLRAAVIIGATLKAVKVKAIEIPGLLSAGLLVSMLVAGAAGLTEALTLDVISSSVLRLLVIVCVCALVLPVAIWLVRGWIRPEVVALLERLADRMPGNVGRRFIALILSRRTPAVA